MIQMTDIMICIMYYTCSLFLKNCCSSHCPIEWRLGVLGVNSGVLWGYICFYNFRVLNLQDVTYIEDMNMQKSSQNGDNGRYSRLDSSTLSYFEEINSHLKSTEDDEEKHLIADNALEEAAGREAEIAADATTSRVIESLIHVASLSSLIKFTNACIDGDSLGYICSRYVNCCLLQSTRTRYICSTCLFPSSSFSSAFHSLLSPFSFPTVVHSVHMS